MHTFCSSVIRYGISWTPISIEQKTGRVDRIGCQLARKFKKLKTTSTEDNFIQVYFPYLKDTVEVYQVRKVCHRLNTFLEGLHHMRGYDKSRFSDPTVYLDNDTRDESPIPPQLKK